MKAIPSYKFRLFIAGDGTNSVQAVENLRSLCLEYLPDRHEIDVIDVLQEPERAVAENVILTPTLLKWAPKPSCRIVGSLSHREAVLRVLRLLP